MFAVAIRGLALPNLPHGKSYRAESRLYGKYREERKQGGRRIVLIWDGLGAHKSRRMQRFLTAQSAWLQIERLPGDAPELNPVEPLWCNLNRSKPSTSLLRLSSSVRT